MKTIKFLPNNQILLNNKTLLTKIQYTKKYNKYKYENNKISTK